MFSAHTSLNSIQATTGLSDVVLLTATLLKHM